MSNLMEAQKNNQLGMVEESRQFAEVKGKIYLAKQFPRAESQALSSILRECESNRLAESATYEFVRGDSTVMGASIRLAEVVARHWGNFESSVVELEQRQGESTVRVYAWDLESNYRDEKVFTVKHERSTKKGSYTLTESRDIYEMVANNAARRKRSCILAVIPSYVFDEALRVCEETLKKAIKGDKSIEQTRASMLQAFGTISEAITPEMLGEKVGKPFDKMDVKDIVKLRNLYNSIKDGFVKANDAFELAEAAPAVQADTEQPAQPEAVSMDDL